MSTAIVSVYYNMVPHRPGGPLGLCEALRPELLTVLMVIQSYVPPCGHSLRGAFLGNTFEEVRRWHTDLTCPNYPNNGLPDKFPLHPPFSGLNSCPAAAHCIGEANRELAFVVEKHAIPKEYHRHACDIARPREKVCKALLVTSLSTPCVPLSWSTGYWSLLDHDPRHYRKGNRDLKN